MSASPLDIALVYIARGIAPIPVPHRAKAGLFSSPDYLQYVVVRLTRLRNMLRHTVRTE
jgi:hypothetical protein